MSLITDIIGKQKSTDVSRATYTILDDIFSNTAIWLQNVIEIVNIPILSQNSFIKSIPLPLIGFSYRPIGEMELLSYEWSQYPYLSKQVITNAGVKQPTRFSVDVFSVISLENPIALNILKISALVKLLDNYVAKGGLFTILTMFGPITDCVLEKITGFAGDEMIDGTHLRFSFFKPNIDTTAAVAQQVTDLISKINLGSAQALTGVQ